MVVVFLEWPVLIWLNYSISSQGKDKKDKDKMHKAK
jgi:hypothetical protein